MTLPLGSNKTTSAASATSTSPIYPGVPRILTTYTLVGHRVRTGGVGHLLRERQRCLVEDGTLLTRGDVVREDLRALTGVVDRVLVARHVDGVWAARGLDLNRVGGGRADVGEGTSRSAGAVASAAVPGVGANSAILAISCCPTNMSPLPSKAIEIGLARPGNVL